MGNISLETIDLSTVKPEFKEKVKQWFKSVYEKDNYFLIVEDKKQPKNNLLVVIDKEQINAIPINVFSNVLKPNFDTFDIDKFKIYKDIYNYSGIVLPIDMYRLLRPSKKKYQNPKHKYSKIK